MAGGTYNHGLISGNIFSQLDLKLLEKGSDCFPLNSEIKLHIIEENRILFPDAMVTCGPIVKSEDDKEAVVNPRVIIEVLSKSTESYDRGDKFYYYRQIPSLKEYILISQNKYQVEVFLKGEREMWHIKRFLGKSSQLKINSLGIEIDLNSIFRNVIFEPK